MSTNTAVTRSGSLTTVTKNRAQLLFMTRELRRHGTITESEVIALRRRWSHHRAAKAGVAVEEELDQLRECLPMRVSDGQAQKGLLWWHQQLYTKAGEPRNTAFLQQCENAIPGIGRTIRRIVKTFSHFELDDFVFEHVDGRWFPHPVYSIWSKDGMSVQYVARPWQNGGSYLLLTSV